MGIYGKIVLFLTILITTACSSGQAINYKENLQSWHDLLWKDIDRQGYDYSCGSASLATLVNGYFGDRIPENIMLAVLVKNLEKAEYADRAKNGFSLLDLKKAAAVFGYSVIGVKLQPEAIFELKGPIIIVLRQDSWEHFAVLKGVYSDKVFLADPARGNTRMPLFAFFDQWDGTALVLDKQGFGLPADYPLALVGRLPHTWPESDSLRQVSPAFGNPRP